MSFIKVIFEIAHDFVKTSYCGVAPSNANEELTNQQGDEFMALADNHALTRAVRKKDSHGLTITELRIRVEDAARAANITTGRSISVSGGAAGRSGSNTRNDGGQMPRRGL